TNNPVLDPQADNPEGIPVSGIIFGGRRTSTIPVVFQAFDWIHGIYLGATLGSETTAAAAGQIGVVRHDPMAMLPFCGYNINYYFVHWMRMRKRMVDCPRIFHVNWFRKGPDGKFLWPGFGENSRVLEWVFQRVNGEGGAVQTPIGYVPGPGDIPTEGLDLSDTALAELLKVDSEDWRNEI